MTRQRFSNMYRMSTCFGVCTIWNGRSSYITIRGKPVGSPIVDNGSLSSVTDTIRVPFPGLLAAALCAPSVVKGAAICPVGWMPPLPASQVPDRSRRGAGAVAAGGAPGANPALFHGCTWARVREDARIAMAATINRARCRRIAEPPVNPLRIRWRDYTAQPAVRGEGHAGLEATGPCAARLPRTGGHRAPAWPRGAS